MIQVMGEEELLAAIRGGTTLCRNCISIRGPGEKRPEGIVGHFARLLEVRLHEEHGRHAEDLAGADHIRAIIDFVGSDRSGYLVHDRSGGAMCTAFALGVGFLLTGSEEAARDLLAKARPEAMPLRRVVGMFDDALGCRLSEVNEKIRKAQIDLMRRELENSVEALPSAD